MSFICLAGAVLAGAAGFVSGLGSAPLQVALVEEVSGHPVGAQFMDYVEPGKVIRLGPRDKVVLGYLRSCIRETITGGIVTVGTEQSDVQSGRLERSKVPCDGDRMLRAANAPGPSAGTVFRSLPRTPTAQFTLFGASPLIELNVPGALVIERIDRSGERHAIKVAKGALLHAAFYDLAASGKALTPGATYKASFGGRELIFKVDPGAQAGRTAVVGRLLRFGASN